MFHIFKFKRTYITLVFTLVLLSTSAWIFHTASCAEKQYLSRCIENSFTCDGIKRTYTLFVPRNIENGQSVPLLIALHGGGSVGKHMISLTRGRFNVLARKEKFIVAYPDAFEKHWNDGREIERYRSNRENVDDVKFISQMIYRVFKKYNVDLRRVYVTGASNGALMSYRLARDVPEKIAAIAPVIANMSENVKNGPPPALPVPVLMIVGTDDPLVPYNGGYVSVLKGRIKLGKVISAQQTALYWARHNGCNLTPDKKILPDRDKNDGTRIRVEAYRGGKDNSEALLYSVIGGGHTWPGGIQYLPEKIIGKTSNDINACDVIWNFFKKHRR